MLVAYIARRFLLTIPAMLAMSVIVFFIVRLVPGDPATAILGIRASPDAVAVLREELRLNDPVWVQYGHWLGNVLQGDLGVDYNSHEPIRDKLLTRFPVTLELALLAMLLSAMMAIPLGVLAATRRGMADHGATALGLVGISIPDFWLGVMLILLMALVLGWLPSSGYVPLRESVWGNLSHMLLPAFTLSLNLAAVLTRTTRAAVLDVLNRPYVRTARAKGLRERAVVVGHVLKNAAVPIVTVMGLQLGYVLGGAVIIEQIFSLPGVGRLTLNAVLERNYPVIQGAVLLITFVFMVVNILTDSLYAVLDPRVRLSGR
ncbi:MAG: peptide/nickel transport system permease protein [Thermomicrobiales bacterium]|jgi:peptide/nickel transport system permease protein|nr:peptide/nickel transport system permease protein [Thermomicrobiales bacterium]